MNAVNQERVKTLIEALRSDKYQQAQSALRNYDNSFCCLGVACEVYRKETGKGQWRIYKDTGEWNFHTVSDKPNSSYLPSSVFNWFGFEGENPELNTWSMIHLNDSLDYSFKQIADALETWLNE